MNSQLALLVQGIQGLPLASFIAAKALIMIGSEGEEEEILFARAELMACR